MENKNTENENTVFICEEDANIIKYLEEEIQEYSLSGSDKTAERLTVIKEKLEFFMKNYWKPDQYHYCIMAGRPTVIRSYPILLCSCCDGKSSIQFNPIEEIERLKK